MDRNMIECTCVKMLCVCLDKAKNEILNELRTYLPDNLDDKLEELMPLMTPKEILTILKDTKEDADLRGAMCRGLAFLDEKQFTVRFFWQEYIQALLEMLKEDNWGLVICALDALSWRPPNSLVYKAIQDLYNHSDPDVRRYAEQTINEFSKLDEMFEIDI